MDTHIKGVTTFCDKVAAICQFQDRPHMEEQKSGAGSQSRRTDTRWYKRGDSW
jgi:hypothetical protein